METASCCSAIRASVQAPPAVAHVLGACARAVYLRTGGDVLALVTPDALRLPCAVVVPRLPDSGPVVVGAGRVAWAGTTLRVVREWAPATVPRVEPDPERVAGLERAVTGIDIGIPVRLDVRSTLGRGPGLTPSGDDLLAGFLLGCRAFGRDVADVEAAVEDGAHRTTALSAALLRHAVAGRCLPEVAAVVHGLVAGDLDRALAALLRVGHTSGTALGRGLLLAAQLPVAVAA
jgi:hypothetical protein